jgi:radical SAM protein with 4Fe4S-binding SPASM domain
MCYEWGDTGAYHSSKAAVLPLETVRSIVAECASHKPYYALFGGEPMMYPFLGEVISLIREAGSRVDMPTNGMFLKKKADLLCDHPANRIWVSLDGPEAINDAQRGEGVFQAVQEGMRTLWETRKRRNQTQPAIGYTFIVTPLTYKHLEEFVTTCIDLNCIDHLSIEFQTFISFDQAEQHRTLFKSLFGISDTPCAQSLARNTLDFMTIDFDDLERQIASTQKLCESRGIYFVNYPKTISAKNYRAYFSKKLEDMDDYRQRCFFPWMYAEIAATGDLTPCHTFYDYPIGNVKEESLSAIWNGERLAKFRLALRDHGLFPACSGCARYYANPDRH